MYNVCTSNMYIYMIIFDYVYIHYVTIVYTLSSRVCIIVCNSNSRLRDTANWGSHIHASQWSHSSLAHCA